MGIFSGCLFACDIDGTLMINGKINPRNIEKIEYFIAYNLNNEVNAYTCYIKTIKQSNKFGENKELLLIK